MRSVVLAGILLLGLPGLAGCLSEGSELLDPVFSVDEIRYWWEGENESLLVVNFTFTNRQNFTVGEEAHPPWIDVTVWEYERTEERSHLYDGPIYRDVGWDNGGRNKFTLYMDGSGPWRDQWYDEKAQKALGITSHSPVVGPVRIPPNASLSPEIVFKPRNHYTGTDGYYAIEVQLMLDYPEELRETYSTPAWVEYHTGCFNHDTEGFYGYWESKNRVCRNWDCKSPRETGAEYSMTKSFGVPKPGTIPDCNATDAVGPYYGEIEWGDE